MWIVSHRSLHSILTSRCVECFTPFILWRNREHRIASLGRPPYRGRSDREARRCDAPRQASEKVSIAPLPSPREAMRCYARRCLFRAVWIVSQRPNSFHRVDRFTRTIRPRVYACSDGWILPPASLIASPKHVTHTSCRAHAPLSPGCSPGWEHSAPSSPGCSPGCSRSRPVVVIR